MKELLINSWTITGQGLTQPLQAGPTFDIMSLLVREGIIDHPYVEDWEVRAQWVGQQDWTAQTNFHWPHGAGESQPESSTPSQSVTSDGNSSSDRYSPSNHHSSKDQQTRAIYHLDPQNDPWTKSRIWLELSQIDTLTEVYLNQQLVGLTTSAFYPRTFDITDFLRSGENALTIIFRSPEARSIQEAVKRPKQYPFGIFPLQSPHRNMIRKPQCHGGWDWGPSLMTSGIYKPIRIFPPTEFLVTEGQVLVMPSPDQSTTQALGQKKDWTVEITWGIKEFSPPDFERLVHHCQNPDLSNLEILITDPSGRVAGQTKGSLLDYLDFPEGKPRFRVELKVANPNLWWPNGLGEQHLYSIRIHLPEGFNADFSLHQIIGFRDLQLITEPDDHGTSFYFSVNGMPFYAKGANWIPADALPTMAGPERVTSLLTSARDANMNMIRVWGGGQYESLHFYEECSRLGLLVWQDFMFACGTYPGDQDFLSEVEQEVSYQVRRLSGIPALGLWCGNNENLLGLQWYVPDPIDRESYLVDYDRLYEGTIGRLVRLLDPTRRYWPSSPSAGTDTYGKDHDVPHHGDMHYWKVWHHGLPLEGYLEVIPRFCSEFGFQSFASPEGISRTIQGVYEAKPRSGPKSPTTLPSQVSSEVEPGWPALEPSQEGEDSGFLYFPVQQTRGKWAPEQDWHLTGRSLDYHQKNPRGNAIIMENILRSYVWPSSTEQVFYTSQVLQARAFETAVDFWRSNAPRSMGSLYWQLNDLWPVASWSSIEYPDKWKLTHYKAKEFFQPLRIALIQHPRKLNPGQYAPRVFDLEAVLLSDTPREGRVRVSLELVSFTGIRNQLINQELELKGLFAQSLGRFSPEDLAIDPRDWFLHGKLILVDPSGIPSESRPKSQSNNQPNSQSKNQSKNLQKSQSDHHKEHQSGTPGEHQPVLSESARFFVPDKSARIQQSTLNLKWEQEKPTENPQVVLTSDAPTFGVFLDTPGLLGRWNHNGVLVLPNEAKTLDFLVRNPKENPWSSGLVTPRDQGFIDWIKKAEKPELVTKLQEVTWIFRASPGV